MKLAPSITIAVLLLSAVVWLALRNQRELSSNLPEKVYCESYEQALKRAYSEASLVFTVLNTGSMYPYLPKIKGADPLKTVVAIAVPSGETCADIVTGKLVVYRSKAGVLVIHSAAKKDNGGWIMSGLNNSVSDLSERVTEANFKCIVSKVYVWNKE